MSIWCSRPTIGHDPDVAGQEQVDVPVQVRSYANGWSNHYPTVDGAVERDARIDIAVIPAWCAGGDHDDFDSVGPWLRLGVHSWRHDLHQPANVLDETSAVVVLDEAAVRALVDQLNGWLSQPKVVPVHTSRVDRLVQQLGLDGNELAALLATGVDDSEAWRRGRPPIDVNQRLNDIEAVVGILERHLRAGAQLALVRTPAERWGGRTLLEALTADPAGVRAVVEAAFDDTTPHPRLEPVEADIGPDTVDAARLELRRTLQDRYETGLAAIDDPDLADQPRER